MHALQSPSSGRLSLARFTLAGNASGPDEAICSLAVGRYKAHRLFAIQINYAVAAQALTKNKVNFIVRAA